jgi:hypothetical protein
MIPHHITVQFPSGFDRPGMLIAVIKAIRGLTRMGLKDARDLTEKHGPQKIKIDPYQMTSPDNGNLYDIKRSTEEYIKSLKDNGVIVVYDDMDAKIDTLQKVAISSIEAGNYEMAIDQLNLIRRYS